MSASIPRYKLQADNSSIIDPGVEDSYPSRFVNEDDINVMQDNQKSSL